MREKVTISVISHLKKHHPPTQAKLKIVLNEIVKAVYSEDGNYIVLKLIKGSVGDNEFENFVDIHAKLNPGIRHHIEGIMDRQFGPHSVAGYHGEMDGQKTAELDEAERRINERLNK